MKKLLPPNIPLSSAGFEFSSNYTPQLLRDLGAKIDQVKPEGKITQVNRWCESGLDIITGGPDRPIDHCPVPVADYADGTLEALELLSNNNFSRDHRGANLLTQRAKFSGDSRKGNISLGSSCRFLPCSDGIIALNLPRESDWELLDAWLETQVISNWSDLAHCVQERSKSELLERGRILGLAVADANPPLPIERNWYKLIKRGPSSSKGERKPRVIDLSSLWAGPLCGQILSWCGADVVKVESSKRPDGARHGSPEFFRFLNQGKAEATLDLHRTSGVNALLELIRNADIVIEASRPRALRQMGISAEELVAEIPGLTWIGISGYGREEPQANWIAYGDDAGVAGGLSAELHQATGDWVFCGDAIADPLTGMHAALAGYASWLAGGGHLLSLSLVQTVSHCVKFHRDACL